MDSVKKGGDKSHRRTPLLRNCQIILTIPPWEIVRKFRQICLVKLSEYSDFNFGFPVHYTTRVRCLSSTFLEKVFLFFMKKVLTKAGECVIIILSRGTTESESSLKKNLKKVLDKAPEM